MVSVRDNSTADAARDEHPGGRLRLLLSAGAWDDNRWAEQLPRLLEPLGVESISARSAEEATAMLRVEPVDLAVVDLALPMQCTSACNCKPCDEAGARLLDLLRRIDSKPPVILVGRPVSSSEQARRLAAALAAGVFAVVDRPVNLELMLEVLRRALRRAYAGKWPDGSRPDEPPTTRTYRI